LLSLHGHAVLSQAPPDAFGTGVGERVHI